MKITICGSLCPEFLRRGRSPRKHPAVTTLPESVWVFDGQDIGQGNLGSGTLQLLKQRNLRVAVPGDLLDAVVKE